MNASSSCQGKLRVFRGHSKAPKYNAPAKDLTGACCSALRLLQQNHLLDVSESAGGETVEVDAARQIARIELHGLVSRFLHSIHGLCDNASEDIVDLERDVDCVWQSVFDSRGGVERIWKVLIQGIRGWQPLSAGRSYVCNHLRKWAVPNT